MSSPFASLLKLQELDTKIDQNKYKVENLEEHEELNEIEPEQQKLNSKVEKIDAQLDDIQKNQKRLEDEIASLEEKTQTYQSQLDSGDITNPKDLQNLETAIGGQKDVQRNREDEILALMEQAETINTDSTELKETLSELNEKIAHLTTKVQQHTANIEDELKGQFQKREEMAKTISPEVMEKYEQLVAHHSGVAVAELVGDKCHGCDLNMVHSVIEVERLKAIPADELAQCAECQRILIIK